MIIMELIKSIILVILSLISIFKNIVFKKNTATYFVLKDNSDLNFIDRRSLVYISKKNISKSVNFVRSDSLSRSILAYFRNPNIIFINGFYNFFLLLFFFKKKFFIEKIHFLFFNFIFNILNIKKFKTIDDYRLVFFFFKICQNNNINTHAYMHGRFSPNLRSQNVLKKFCFDNYYVWSNFFKKELIKINPNYQYKNIHIIKKFPIVKKKNISNLLKILFISENKISNSLIIKILKILKLEKKFKIFYKFRPNELIDKKLQDFLINHNIEYFHKENLTDIFLKDINCLIAFNSTALLEASNFLVFPIRLYLKKPFKIVYSERKTYFNLKINKFLNNNIIKILRKNNQLKKIQRVVWQ
jgi:hypothetical protein